MTFTCNLGTFLPEYPNKAEKQREIDRNCDSG